MAARQRPWPKRQDTNMNRMADMYEFFARKRKIIVLTVLVYAAMM
jgi:hypothetical protein